MALAPPSRRKIGNSIYKGAVVTVAKPVRWAFKLVRNPSQQERYLHLNTKGSSIDQFSVDENLSSASVPLLNPRDIRRISEEDQLLKDDEEGWLPETESQDQFLTADEVKDLEDRISKSKLLEDEDDENAVIFRSTKLFVDGVVEPHVRVWSNRPCAFV